MYGLWRDVFSGISKDNPDIEANYGFVDAVAMNLVRKPEIFQVIVTPNLFGDILTDLGAGIQGSLGLSPSGNINPEGISMFEPVHGSAPKYQGLGVANPVATILAGQMMLDEIGEKAAARELETAVYSMLSEKKVRTPDLGGKASTMDIADAVIAKL
jgi:3-isopropylmalate dehydrogenase